MSPASFGEIRNLTDCWKTQSFGGTPTLRAHCTIAQRGVTPTVIRSGGWREILLALACGGAAADGESLYSALPPTRPRLSAIHTIWAEVLASSFCLMAD